MGHASSPVRSPAAASAPTSASSVPYSAACCLPSPRLAAPVRVATSIRTSGSSVASAHASASASTSRPSASVLAISTVVPPYVVRTSPGRYDAAPTWFSASGRTAVTRCGTCACAAASTVASATAEPAMSVFIGTIASRGLIDRPPVS